MDLTHRRVLGKDKYKRRRYISFISPETPTEPIFTKFDLGGGHISGLDVIMHSKFSINQLRVLILWRVEFRHFWQRNEVAVNTMLQYHAASDAIVEPPMTSVPATLCCLLCCTDVQNNCTSICWCEKLTKYRRCWSKGCNYRPSSHCTVRVSSTIYMSASRGPDVVPHCPILSPDKTEWQLISATLCGWRRCFVADQLWFMTRIWEEEEEEEDRPRTALTFVLRYVADRYYAWRNGVGYCIFVYLHVTTNETRSVAAGFGRHGMPRRPLMTHWAKTAQTDHVTLQPWSLTLKVMRRGWCGSSSSIRIPSLKFVGLAIRKIWRTMCVTLTFDLETSMRVASIRGSFTPNLGTLGLRVLELFAMYATDGRTDGRTDKSNAYCPPPFLRTGAQ